MAPAKVWWDQPVLKDNESNPLIHFRVQGVWDHLRLDMHQTPTVRYDFGVYNTSGER